MSNRNRIYNNILFYLTVLQLPLCAMEHVITGYTPSIGSKDVFRRICLTEVCEYPWQELARTTRLKQVCKSWYSMVPSLKDLSAQWQIGPIHCAAARGDGDEIVRLKLKEGYSLQEPDGKMFTPSSYACGMKQARSMKILQMASALFGEGQNGKPRLILVLRD